MSTDIVKVKSAIKHFMKNKIYKEIAIVIYRDHDCVQNVVETFPQDGSFTTNTSEITKFLDKVNTYNSRSASTNEAALDGLAQAAEL